MNAPEQAMREPGFYWGKIDGQWTVCRWSGVFWVTCSGPRAMRPFYSEHPFVEIDERRIERLPISEHPTPQPQDKPGIELSEDDRKRIEEHSGKVCVCDEDRNIFKAGAEYATRYERGNSPRQQFGESFDAFCERTANSVKNETIIEQAEQLATLKAEREELIEALDKIANPIKFFQREAEKDGSKLDGMMAVQLADNGPYLRLIAKEAIEKHGKEKEV